MSFFRLLKRHRTLTTILLLLIAVVGISAYNMRPQPPVYQYETVTSRDIIQQVSVTGSVTPDLNVDLSFQAGGKVSKIFAKVGDSVKAGQTVIALDSTSLEANLQQARAGVDAATAQLQQLQAGTRPEQIAIQKVQLANAQTAYVNAQDGVVTSIRSAYTAADDAIRNKTDKFFSNPRAGNPTLNLSLNDFGLTTTLQSERMDLETTLASWQSDNAQMTGQNLDTSVATGEARLNKVRTFLDNCALALSVAVPGGIQTQAIIDGYKSDISISRTTINSTISSLKSVNDTLSSAKSNVDLQNSNLLLAQAPTLPETISAQKAAVEQAQANVRSLEATLSNMMLKSPIDGTITKQDAKPGEIVTPGVIVVSVISKNQLKVEANIPEADIAKVKIGNKAATTLDAYGDAVNFPTTVASIDPGQTMIEGVATYKTTLQFITPDDRVKPGMTANIDILTQQKNNISSLPQRVMIRKGSDTFVQILNIDGVTVDEIPVVTGLRGSDGNTEIVSGLNLGDKVIIPKN